VPERGAPAAPRGRIAAVGLGFRYASGGGVDDLTFTVEPGEVFGILGPNGSGKSTLVRLLAGLLAPQRGRVELGGEPVASLARREIARRLALVPQEPRFEADFTALEAVLLGRHPHLAGVAFESERDVAIARAALARVDAGALAERPVEELSAGERQRVVMARALAQETPALALDEPSSFLDLRHQVRLFDLVRELAAEGRAVVAVLHDLSLAAEYCDRVLLLEHGRAAALGTTAEALTYANLTRVFETEVYVDVHDLTGGLIVAPLSARARAALAARPVEPPRR
jgi:iron complex transport system ATP-binding protein